MRMRLSALGRMEVVEQDRGEIGALRGPRGHRGDDSKRRTGHLDGTVSRLSRDRGPDEGVGGMGGGGTRAEFRLGRKGSVACELSRTGGSPGTQRGGRRVGIYAYIYPMTPSGCDV